MDSLELLRENRPEGERPTPEAITAARAALMNAIDAEKQGSTARTKTAPKRRLAAGWRWGLTGAAAAAAAGALVLTQALSPVDTPLGPDPAAAAILEQAADNAVRFSDPQLTPGQYLKVTTTERGIATGDGVEFWTGEDSVKYVPADPNAPWVQIRVGTGPLRPAGATTPQQFSAIVADYERVDPETGRLPDRTEYLSALGGDFYPQANGVTHAEWLAIGDPSATPQQLLDRIRQETTGAGRSPDHEAFVWLSDRLRTGELDATTRSLFYRTAALIPGVTVAESTVVLDGRSGVALWAPPLADRSRTQLVLNPETGAYIGEREYAPVSDEAGAELALRSTQTSTQSVVDEAPAAPDTP